MGLTILDPVAAASSEGSLEPQFDVVIVHGLNGDAARTWTHPDTKAFWPKDFLAKDVPEARICLFSYNADAAFGNTVADTVDHARALLSCLIDVREGTGEKKRPIIFVAHSLGGIVVKQALVSARTNPNYSSISDHTIGLIFFGTPHRGSQIATYGKVLASIAAALMNSPSPALLSALQSNSDVLQRLTSDFKHQLPQYQIVSFYETKPTSPFKTLIVQKNSALLDTYGEDQVPVDADHRSMCRFPARDHEDYQKLRKRIGRMVKVGESKDIILEDGKVERGFRNEHYYLPRNVSAAFTGRKEVSSQLQASCFDPQKSEEQRIYVLFGLGGSGKTQMALKFAHDNRGKFWGIFWIDCSSGEAINKSWKKIGRHCKIAEDVDTVKNWLTNSPDPWLLILDNADDPSLDILSCIPVGSKGTILITTRNRDCKVHATIGSHEFAGLDMEEAVMLLRKVAGISDTADEKSKELANTIVTKLGCLALAIVQAGAVIRQGLYSMEEYVEAYEVSHTELLSRAPSQASGDYKYTVYSTWEVSIAMISGMDSQISRRALDLLCLFSFMHFDGITEKMFSQCWINLKSAERSKRTEGHQLDWLYNDKSPKWRPILLREPLVLLSSFSLIAMNSSNVSSMHPLVHSWAKDRLNEEERDKWSKTAASVLSMSIKSTLDAIDFRFRRSLIPHIVSCLEYLTIDALLIESDDTIDGMAIASKFALAYSENGLIRETLDLRRRIVECTTSSEGEESLNTLASLQDLAKAYYFTGLIKEAMAAQEKCVEGRQKILGNEHPDTLSARGLLTNGYLYVGRVKEALAILEEVLDKQKKILPIEHADVLASMTTLCGIYYGVSRYQDGVRIIREVLQIEDRCLGSEHPDTLIAMNHLSVGLGFLGFYQEGGILEEKNLEIAQRTRGQQHMDTIMSMANLAFFYHNEGRFQEALEMAENAAEMGLRIWGKEHPDILLTMAGLATSYSALGRYNDAFELQEEALILCTKLLGAQNPRTMTMTSNMAACYGDLERYEEEAKLEEYALEYEKTTNGDQHESTARIMRRLSVTYCKLGRGTEAVELGENALKVLTMVFEGNHPVVDTAMVSLAEIYCEVGRHEAIEMAEKATVATSKRFGEENPYTLSAKSVLAKCYNQAGSPEDAVGLGNQVVTLRRQVLGEKHPLTLKSIKELEGYRSRLEEHKGSQSLLSGSSSGSATIQDSKSDDKLGQTVTTQSSTGAVKSLESKKLSEGQTAQKEDSEDASKKRWDLKSRLLRRR